MVAVSLLQVKKLSWGKLSQISQGKSSDPKYCEFSDENCEELSVVFHCQNDLKPQRNIGKYRNIERTIGLRLKEIRYCSIVARGSLKTLACYSLPKY